MTRPLHVLGALLGLAALFSGGCLDGAAGGRPTVWAVGDGAVVDARAPVQPETALFSARRQRVTLSAALNETIAFQLAIRAPSLPPGPLDVHVSDLSGPGGRLAAAEHVRLFRVESVTVEDYRSWYPDHAGRPALPSDFPDILVPWDAPRGGGPLRLKRGATAAVWCDLHVPPTAEPGEYTGTLRVTSGAAQSTVYQATIALRVWPMALPSARTLPVVCRVDPRDLLGEHLRWPRLPAEETLLLRDEPAHQAALRLVDATMQLLHEHRTTPALWASFPRFRPRDSRSVDVDWAAYDALVGPYIDGSAYADRVAPALWPLPVSLDYPSAAREGGLNSPRYAALLGAYAAAGARHFADSGWTAQAFVRPIAPGPLTAPHVAEVQRVAGILRQAGVAIPLMAHLPPRSLRGLGWFNAPTVELSGVNLWAPPGRWAEPDALHQEQLLDRRAWLVPDYPPYSGSLAPEAPPADAMILPWLAYRYDLDGLWLEHAADVASAPDGSALVYPGTRWGLVDRPVPSVRLKRLRRGLQDYELARLLQRAGRELLARRIAGQLVRYGLTDACRENLLSCLPTGWSPEPDAPELARTLLRQELVNVFTPSDAGQAQQLANLAQWQLLLSAAQGLRADVQGVRLADGETAITATARVTLVNTTERSVTGNWTITRLPPEWTVASAPPLAVPAGSRRPAALDMSLPGVAYNTDGIYPLELGFDTAEVGTVRTTTRLAVAAAAALDNAPRIDGNLADWPLAAGNAAGSFLLCRGRTALDAENPYRPTVSTRAFFAVDREYLYIAVRCGLAAGERALWRADNTVPIDGAVPWGQDVVEVLLSPENAHTGTPGDLYQLQVKPTGLVIARRGCLTDPPLAASEPWNAGARVAVDMDRDAWVAEIALPLAALGPSARQNRIWGANVTRLDARRGEYSSWSGARGHCYAPESLGNLILLRP